MSMQQASAVDSVLVEQLREILGPGLGRRRLEQLLTQAYGSVQRAVDLHFSAASDSVGAQVPGSSTARATAEPSNSVGPSSAFQAVAPARHPRTSSGRRTTSSGFRSRADFVELSSSSTDNEFDPAAPSNTSSSEDEQDQENTEAAIAAILHVAGPAYSHGYARDWGRCLGFGITRDHLTQQTAGSNPPRRLPFAKLRGPDGRLFRSSAQAIPEQGAQALQFPVHLGTLRLPVIMESTSKAQNLANKAKSAAAKESEVLSFFYGPEQDTNAAPKVIQATRRYFEKGRIRMQLQAGTPSQLVAVVPINPNKDSSLGCIHTHLEELLLRRAIFIQVKLVKGPPHPKLVEAADLAEDCKYSNEVHAAVEVQLQEGLVPSLDDINNVAIEADKKGMRNRLGQKLWARSPPEMTSLLNWLLMTDDTGLAIGPDSDGLLNFCEASSRAPLQDSPGAADDAVPAAGLSRKARGRRATPPPAATAPSLSRSRAKPAPAQAPDHDSPPDNGSSPEPDSPRCSVQQMLDSVALPDEAPAAPAPATLRTIPKHFQLQGLHWMLAREQQGDALGRGHLHLHPEWVQLVAADRQVVYWNRSNSHFCSSFVPAEVGGTCGGFLCDEMGLGKTLQSLMLILSNPAPKSWPVRDLSKQQAQEGEAIPIKTTLLVMPANLLQQWQDEMAKHVQDGALSWCIYDAKISLLHPGTAAAADGSTAHLLDGAPMQTRRTRSQQSTATQGGSVKLVEPLWGLDARGRHVQVQKQDVALMTYEQLRKELSSSNRSPLLQFGFWRVMLDEAQLVAATSSVAAQMTSSLWRRHAWVVTGTPITSHLAEIQGLLEFLAYEPFYHRGQWYSLVEAPLAGSHPDGSLPLKALLQGVMLRRTKAHVGAQLSLPPCEHVERWVSLSSAEQSFYDRLHKQVLSSLELHQNAQKRKRQASFCATQHGGRLVRQFTELRQCCCHPQIVRGATNMLGKGRLSMQAIMERLTARAYNEYDRAMRAHMLARLLQEAVAVPAEHKPGPAYLGVLQQIMAAVAPAAQLEVANLLEHRSPDGFLPPASSSLDDSQPSPLTIPSLLRPQAASQLQHADTKAQDAKQQPGQLEIGPQQGVAAAQAQTSGPEHPLQSQLSELQTLESDRSIVDILMLPQLSGDSHAQTEQPKSGSETTHAQLGNGNHNSGGVQLPGSDLAVGGSNPQKGGVSGSTLAKPLHSRAGDNLAADNSLAQLPHTMANGRAPSKGDAEPQSDRLVTDGLHPAGPSANGHLLPDQDMAQQDEEEVGPSSSALPGQQPAQAGEEEAGPSSSALLNGTAASSQQRKRKHEAMDDAEDPELKEKREVARARHRAWRKVLLDGLDLFSELTQAAANASPGDIELEQDRQAVESEAQSLKAELGLEPELAQVEEAPRFSKRARQMEPETELGLAAAVHLSKAHAAHLRAANLVLKTYDDLRARRSSKHSAALVVKSSQDSLKAKWGTVQHLYNKHLEVTAGAKGKAVATAPGPSEQVGEVAQEDVNTCPICLDECASRTVTACGHYYCSACIHELVEGGGQGGGGVPCPLCRSPLQAGDLYDAVTDEEAAEARKAASVQGDYGSKVSALLLELAAMKQADPTAKAIIFSSWSRLLRLIEEALGANGFTYTSIAGVQAQTRAAALKTFLTDPDCSVLTVIMSTSGGASGLTLTAASHVFLMEPNLNPGLEAQAAGRVYRLGQTKPTRVIRLLTEGTVEKALLAYQRSKAGSADQDADQLQERELLAGNTLASIMAAHP